MGCKGRAFGDCARLSTGEEGPEARTAGDQGGLGGISMEKKTGKRIKVTDCV